MTMNVFKITWIIDTPDGQAPKINGSLYVVAADQADALKEASRCSYVGEMFCSAPAPINQSDMIRIHADAVERRKKEKANR